MMGKVVIYFVMVLLHAAPGKQGKINRYITLEDLSGTIIRSILV